MQNCLVITGSVLFLFWTLQFTGCGASCPEGYVTLEAKAYTKILTSPNYPENYDSPDDCRWKVKAPENYVVHLQLVDLVIGSRIPFYRLCYNVDRLYIDDPDSNSSAIAICGEMSSRRQFFSTGRTMDIYFVSNSSSTYRGFKLEYSAIPVITSISPTTMASTLIPFTFSCPAVPVNLQAQPYLTMNLTSPNYPRNYNNNENCRWRITAPEYYVVHILVADLTLEGSIDSYCDYDSLSIYNTDGLFASVVLCGSLSNPRHFYSVGQTTDISFVSDYSNTNHGFRLEYSAIRPSDVPSTTTMATTTMAPTTANPSFSCPVVPVNLQAQTYLTMNLTSPNYPRHYRNNENCRWRITAPDLYVVHIRVADLTIASGFDQSCRFDRLTITDTASSPVVLCGKLLNPRHFFSIGRTMDISFVSDEFSTDRGFRLEYSAVGHWDVPTTSTLWPTATPYTIYLAASMYSSQSLQWPDDFIYYARKPVNVRWSISCVYDCVIELTAETLPYNSFRNCDSTKITVYDSDGDTLLGKMCSRSNQGDIFTSSRKEMYVHFTDDSRSDSSFSFTLSYRATRSYSTSYNNSSPGNMFSFVMVAVGVVGAILFITCICFVIRAYIRKRQTSRPPSRLGAAAAAVQPRSSAANGQAGRFSGVYIMPTHTQASGARTNLAFSPDVISLGPPPYSSLQFSAPLPPPRDASELEMAPLPSYAEALMMVQSPLGYKVDGDETHHSQLGAAVDSTPPPIMPPSSPPSGHQDSVMVVGSNLHTAPDGRPVEDA